MRIILWLCALLLPVPLLGQPIFAGADSCGSCHTKIASQWRQSMHANAVPARDPLYRGMLGWAVRDSRGKLREKCTVCHAPLSRVFGNADFSSPASAEGVTCVACHGAKEVRGTHSARDILYHLRTIYSDHPDTSTDAHAAAHRDHFLSGRLCLACHAEMKSPTGVAVCATGPEWKAFAARTGKNCVDCHMPMENGVRSHLFAGGHLQMKGARTVQLDLKYRRETCSLRVAVTNVGGGHALPTGTPLRMIAVRVQALGPRGKVLWQNWRTNPAAEDRQALFMKILADSAGHAPVPPWRAARVAYDRRMLPGKTYEIRYTVPDSLDGVAEITATVLYRYAPPPILKKLGITEGRLTRPRILARKILAIGKDKP